MHEQVVRTDERDEYFFEEGCFVLEILNRTDDPAVSVARARVPSGGRTRRHRLHGIAERYVILAGSGTVEVGSLGPQPVAPGDVVVIPPLVPQRVVARGDGGLVFLAICTPRFVPEAYEDLEV